MGLVDIIKRHFARMRRQWQLMRALPRGRVAVSLWFVVRFDDEYVRIRAEPPGREPWTAEFRWADVVRVCYQTEDFTTSDGIYVFTSQRPESYAIPAEADGGHSLWNEIVDRGLFDPTLAIVAMGSAEGLFCWPPPQPATADSAQPTNPEVP